MVKRKSGKLPPTKSAKKALRRQGKLRKTIVPKGVVRDAWDEKLSAAANIERIGLKASVNKIPISKYSSQGRQVPSQSKIANRVERVDVRESLESEASRPERKTKAIVRPGEERALREMIEIYGDDYQRMASDIKRNYFQFTPAQLRRKCVRRAAILADQA